MPTLPRQAALEAMIEQAMKDRAPAMYRELKVSGELPKVLKSRATAAQESYEIAMSEVTFKAASASRNLTWLESVQEATAGRNAAVEVAIAQACEFQDDERQDQRAEGIDTEILAEGVECAIFHIEAGARTYEDFSQIMVSELGESARPFLRSLYEGIRHYPGAEALAREMTSPEEIEAAAFILPGSETAERSHAPGDEVDELTGPTSSAHFGRNMENDGVPEPPGSACSGPLKKMLYFNEDSGGKTDVTLTQKPDGSLELFYYDIGPASKAFWGDSDYENWITIPAEALSQLAFWLIAEKYEGRSDSVSDLRDFCKEHGIEHNQMSWA